MAVLEDRSSRWAASFLGLYVLGVLPSLGQPLLESHAYRQTQTAFTAVLYAERGIDMLRPPLPVLGPPGILPLEFPLFQAMGSLIIDAGVTADLAMRLTGTLCFTASAVLLYLLARRVAGTVAALASLAAFLFNSHAWLYGRASLIEYLATAGGLGFLLLSTRWVDERRKTDWVGAFLAGSVGVLVKITTGAFYLLPVLLWRAPSGRWGFQHLSVWLLLAGVGAVGAAWSSYSDAVRASMAATEFLATENQYGWLFGTVGQRFDLGSWRVPLVALLALSGSGIFLWAVLALREMRTAAQPAFLLAALSIVVVVPLTFFNLYAVHDYYFAAIAPMVALGVGLGFAWLSRNLEARRPRMMAVGLAGAWVATLAGTIGSWWIIYPRPDVEEQTLAVARFVADNSEPDDWVVLDGFGWNSTFLYYARRQGFAVPEEDTRTANLDVEAILNDPIYGPFFTCQPNGDCIVSDTRETNR